MSDTFFAQLLRLLEAGDEVASATIVSTRGSTPLEAGAKMLVQRSGAILGTIGGGCGEAEVWRTALQVIESREPRVVFVDLTGEISMDSASVCGGTMDVLVEAWGSRDIHIVKAVVDRIGHRQPSMLVTAVSTRPATPWRTGDRALVGPEGVIAAPDCVGVDPESRDWLVKQATAAVERGTYSVSEYVPRLGVSTDHGVCFGLDPVRQPPLLAIVGAGHIAVPLAQLGKMLGFSVAVLDDRAAFANKERFPDADIVRAAEFATGIRELPIDADSYVVLITRGHQHDVECLEAIIESDAAYIGMIGSRRRVRAVFELLAERGVAGDRLARVHAPIGLDIGAKTPAEIAVSIAAEVINVRRGGRAVCLTGSSGLAETSRVQSTDDPQY